jgi:hypothetical protein
MGYGLKVIHFDQLAPLTTHTSLCRAMFNLKLTFA